MTGPLNIHNATIHTASIEIRTLTISGKQVTLAVFRQLPTCEFSDRYDSKWQKKWSMRPGVDLWGTVRYSINREHEHIVFTEGGVLYRCSYDSWDLADRYDPTTVKEIEALPQLFIAV